MLSCPDLAQQLNSDVLNELEDLWLFAYGSLVWRPGDLRFVNQCLSSVKGYILRFWQASIDHRGVEGFPGRVVTLVPGNDEEKTDGVAYLIDNAVRLQMLEYLDIREKGGYMQTIVDITLATPYNGRSVVRALMYVGDSTNPFYCGKESVSDISKRVAWAHGPSGSNREYLFNLAAALRAKKIFNAHVFDVEQAVRLVLDNAATVPMNLIPGPVDVPKRFRDLYLVEYLSPDLESEFFDLYSNTQGLLAKLLNAPRASHTVEIMSGEAMVVLWGAMKSIVKAGDRVLSIATGVYGYGFADMARSLGAIVEVVGLDYNKTINFQTLNEISMKVAEFSPIIITAVHCETPSGTLNELKGLGQIARDAGALFYVDFVSSFGAHPVDVSDWHIDIGLLGTQKVLSLPPDSGIVAVSERAWKKIEDVKYVGYDALLPFRNAVADCLFPYTMNWAAMSALNLACHNLCEPAHTGSGLTQSFANHAEVAVLCRHRIQAMGLCLFAPPSSCANSITAVIVPEGWTWRLLDAALRAKGVRFAGSYGILTNKVFRIGHMGSQCDFARISKALDVLEIIIKDGPVTIVSDCIQCSY